MVKTLSQAGTYALLFAIGLIAISIQFIYIRQTGLYVGSSTVTTMVILSVFLAALASGLRAGGANTDNHLDKLSKNCLISGFILGLGPSVFVVSTYFDLVIGKGPIIAGIDLSNPLFHLLLYLLFAMGPLVYLVEQSTPLLINYMRSARASYQAGMAFHISTWGNVLGGAITTLIIMQYLSIGWAIFINAAGLFFVSILTAPSARRKRYAMIMTVGIPLSYLSNIAIENYFYVASNTYGHYRVIQDKEGGAYFSVNHGQSSYVGPEGQGAPYMQFIRKTLDDLRIENKKVLALGAGGFSFTAGGDTGNDVTYVDIDPQIKDIAEAHFLDKKIPARFIAADARAFLLGQSPESWDAVVFDVFSGNNNIPPTLITEESFSLLKTRIKPGGYLFLNAVMHPTLKDPYSQRLDRTIRQIFGYCMTHLSDYSQEITSVLYICTVKPQGSFEGTYRDSRLDSELDALHILKERRR